MPSERGEGILTPDQREIFESFYRDHFQEVVSYAFSFLKQWDDAQDVAQESFRTLIIHFDSFLDSPNQVGWIKTVAKNHCRHMLRAQARLLHSEVPLDSLIDELPLPEKDRYASTAMEECEKILTPKEMDLLRRIVIDGASYQKVAKDMAITEWACYKRIQRITRKLKERWHKNSL